MSDPDWHLTESTLAGLQFIEWLIVNDGDPNNFTDVYETDPDAAWASAEDQGWVETIHPDKSRPRRLGERVPDPRPKPTGAGHRQIDQVKRLRGNNVARGAACRQAILLWLYNDGRCAAGTDEFTQTACQFYGTPFTEDEVSDAITYLLDRGLIQGIKAWGPVLARPALTPDGIECVENHDGDVRAFLAPHQSGHATFNQNFNAPVTGQVAQGQTVNQTQHQGVDADALAEIFKAMLDARSDINDPDDRDDVEHAIRDLHAAVDEGDPAEVKKRVGRLQRLVNRVGSTVLITATTTGTNQLLQLLGLG